MAAPPPPPATLTYRDLCVGLNCATPGRRAFVAAGVIGVVALAIKQPSGAFTKEGAIRPWKVMSNDPEATHSHFLILPAAAAVVALLIS